MSTKASTAALRRICQRLLLIPATRTAPPGWRPKRPVNFYSLTEGYFGREGMPG